jgi:hypothetical protein
MYDALQLQLCGENGTATSPARPGESSNGWQPHSTFSSPPQDGGVVVYVDAQHGSDAAAGTVVAPLHSIEAAIRFVRKHRSSTQARTEAAAPHTNASIVLRAGTYYLAEPITLTAQDSWLTIMNFENERAEVSGGVLLSDLEWRVQRDVEATTPRGSNVAGAPDWILYNNTNNVFGEVLPGRDGRDGCVYIAKTDSATACEHALAASPKRPEDGWKSFTWQPLTAGKFAGQCYGLTSDHWAPHYQAGFVSGRHNLAPPPPKQQIAVTKLAGNVPGQITGLRANGSRAIRARFPNIRSTESQPYAATGPLTGYITARTEWKPPRSASPPTEIVVTQLDFPSVEWVSAAYALAVYCLASLFLASKCVTSRSVCLSLVAADEHQ